MGLRARGYLVDGVHLASLPMYNRSLLIVLLPMGRPLGSVKTVSLTVMPIEQWVSDMLVIFGDGNTAYHIPLHDGLL